VPRTVASEAPSRRACRSSHFRIIDVLMYRLVLLGNREGGRWGGGALNLAGIQRDHRHLRRRWTAGWIVRRWAFLPVALSAVHGMVARLGLCGACVAVEIFGRADTGRWAPGIRVDREHRSRPTIKPGLELLVASLMFAPVLVWNLTHA
jgi:hypothetical protein